MADPYPKSKQLARGERRYRRKVASPKQWQAILQAKVDGCGCRMALYHWPGSQQAHHLVARVHGGDDVPDNIVPLCPDCHDKITRRDPYTAARLMERLHDREYAYMIDKGGEDYPERAYGIRYTR